MRSQLVRGLLLLLALTVCLAQAGESSSSSSSPPSLGGSSGGKTASSSGHHATQSRQSGVSSAASLVGAIGSLVPGLITNLAPLVLLFGLGALMMPALGTSAMGLLRESRRSSNDQLANNNVPFPANFAQYARPLQTSPQDIYYFTKRSLPGIMSSMNTAGLVSGLQDILERVLRAIENADKRYN